MSKLVAREKGTDQVYCQWLQSDSANYHYDVRANAVYLNNRHHFNEDLSVQRLPTDGPALTDFLNTVEGRSYAPFRSVISGPQLLVVTSEDDGVLQIERVVQGYDVLHEEHFQYSWPADARKIDKRDGIHRQGYALLNVSGSLGGDLIEGTGVIPVTYRASQTNPAWLSLRIGSTLVFDGPGGMALRDSHEGLTKAYPAGHAFAGIGRPWEGLHVMDIIRRDAARYQIPFAARYLDDKKNVQIDLSHAAGSVQCIVSVDMDWLESIVFLNAQGQSVGRMDFTYHETLENLPDPSTLPRMRAGGISVPDSLWFITLAEERSAR